MSNPPKRRALGRGLSALLPNSERVTNPSADSAANPAPADTRAPSADPGPGRSAAPAKRDYFQAQIEDIHPSPEQPRRRFDDSELEELAQSIRSYGVIQPLIVRRRPEGGYYLVAGERRWRAAQRAGLHQTPVVVQELEPKQAFERALVENLQRSDLNAIEEAEAYHRLVTEFDYTQEQVAERVGKERSTVANSLRLLRLPPSVRGMVEDRRLSMGHARALLGLEPDDIEPMARQVASRELSVRATETLVRKRLKPADKAAEAAKKPQKSASVRDLEHRLTRSLSAEVTVTEGPKPGSGHIQIRYIDLNHLDQLLERLLD